MVWAKALVALCARQCGAAIQVVGAGLLQTALMGTFFNPSCLIAKGAAMDFAMAMPTII
jgi:hypothetical protein